MDGKTIAIACAAGFALGIVSLLLLSRLFGASDRKKRRRRNSRASKEKPEKKVSWIERIGVMNLILIIVGAALLIFTVAMIELFKVYGMIPDTLVSCVFAVLGGECGVMGWIKTNKDKHQDRKWQKEDMQGAQPPPSAEDDFPKAE